MRQWFSLFCNLLVMCSIISHPSLLGFSCFHNKYLPLDLAYTSLSYRLPEHIHGKKCGLHWGSEPSHTEVCDSMHRKPAKLDDTNKSSDTLLCKQIYRKPSFWNCSCRMSLYSSKPPSILVTVPFSQTHSSRQTRRMKRSSWDTRITPP